MQEPNDIEGLMRDLARSSVELRKALFRNDTSAATTPEGIDGATIRVITCTVCYRTAAGPDAQIRHETGCRVKKLHEAQSRLRAVWPELFRASPKLETPAEPIAKVRRAAMVRE